VARTLPPPVAFSLIEAHEHIGAARVLIRKYIATEEPGDFGLAVLEGLLREVDNLGNELDDIISAQALTPKAEESISIIELVKTWAAVKGSLKDLVEVLGAILDQFS
jgi:hypothetical protein